MADKKAYSNYQGESIKKDGKCWIYTGKQRIPVTDTTVEGVFDDCTECGLASSSSSNSSNSSSSSSSAGVMALCSTGDCGTDASMEISVTNGGATETINWCGETWNLPGDNGLAKCVCPAAYELKTDPSYKRHRWTGAGGSAQALILNRYFLVPYPWKQASLRVIYSQDQVRWLFNTSKSTGSSDLGMILGASIEPTTNDYQITDEFFGSHTIGAVTYTWAKGADWP